MDVEASIRGERLDIGVFAPRFLLGGEGAGVVVEGIREVLEGCR